MKRIALAVALVVMGGCTGMTFEPLNEQPPIGLYNVVGVRSPIGRRAMANIGFQSRLLDALRGSKAFAEVEVLEPGSAPLLDSGLRVSSSLWEKKTRGGWNYFSGYTQGRHYVGATVLLWDSKARHVATFSTRHVATFTIRRYGGLSSSYEVGSLADEAAAAIVRWSRGEGLSR